MTSPLHNQIEQAYAEFARQRDALTALTAESDQAETTVTAKNRGVAVTVNGQAAVTAIKFPTSAYRTMSAAELGTVLVETIEAARSQATAEAMGRYRAVLPQGLAAVDPLDGGFDVQTMFARAARIVNDNRFDEVINNPGLGDRE